MNFYKFLRLNLFYFQLCGFYPYQIVRTIHSNVNKSVLLIVTLFNLASVIVQTTFVFWNHNIFFKHPMLLGKLVDMNKYAFLAMTCMTILIESIETVNDQKSFWAISWNLQKNFHELLPSSMAVNQQRIYRKNLLKTYVAIIAVLCVQIYLLIQRTCVFCSVYTLLTFHAFSKYLQYILYVDIIHQQAVNLGCELERIVEISVYMKSRNKLSDDLELFLVKRLKIASSFYVKLYDLSVNVNSAFGWSLVINLVHSYIQIFVDFFWMFQLVANGYGEYLCECFISMLPSFIIVGLVFYTTTDCHKQVHNVTMKVHDIKENENTTQLSTMVHNFILQTKHLPIILEAKGFFSMDFTPLKDMVTSITTSMVFIIQSSVRTNLEYLLDRDENGNRII